jgi:serine/threonine protein kinase
LKSPGISTSSDADFVTDAIQTGPSSVVKFALDLKPNLIAVKTALHPDFAERIRREIAILKELKHPLIVELRDHNSAVVTGFVGNESLASHFTAERRLQGANRITRIIVGIALGMRFVHSRNIIHRNLTPDNILLDWDWNVRIADFGSSAWSNKREFPTASNNGPYLAPEGYDRTFLFAGDVFAFGLIAYELLAGQPAFAKTLSPRQIQFIVCVECGRPEIPDFLPESVRVLIAHCWAHEPGDRPTFDEIVDRLKEMEFKLTANVNSAKLKKFVQGIEEWEQRTSPSN